MLHKKKIVKMSKSGVVKTIPKKNTSFANVYFIKLLFSEKPDMPSNTAIEEKLKHKFENFQTIMASELLTGFALNDHLVEYNDNKSAPSQLMLYGIKDFDISKVNIVTRSQCWNIENINEFLNECNYELMVSDFLANGLPYEERCNILVDYVDVLLELFPSCLALYFIPSDKIIPTDIYLKANNDATLRFLDGGTNIRFFRVKGSKDFIIDTVGLSAIGLYDFQCHFNTINHNKIIENIYDLIIYTFKNGSVIENGQTVDGLIPGEKWTCQTELSLISPTRPVIDLNVGEHASGRR